MSPAKLNIQSSTSSVFSTEAQFSSLAQRDETKRTMDKESPILHLEPQELHVNFFLPQFPTCHPHRSHIFPCDTSPRSSRELLVLGTLEFAVVFHQSFDHDHQLIVSFHSHCQSHISCPIPQSVTGDHVHTFISGDDDQYRSFPFPPWIV